MEMLPTVLIQCFAFLTGISIGSFITLASYRLPRDQEIIFRDSYCPSCNKPLKVIDLFPLFSWLFMRGKCRQCHTPISARYPLIEAFTGVTFLAIVMVYGQTWQSLLLVLLASEIILLIVTDLEHYIIPDSVQVAMALTGIAYTLHFEESLVEMGLRALMGLALGLALHFGYLKFRKKDALGLGDVKFLAVAGIWLPLSSFVPFLFIAGVMGTVTGLLWQWAGRGALFPFGPALAVSMFINVVFPNLLATFQ